MYLQMTVVGVALDPNTNGPVILLRDLEERYTLPIWVGLLEAASISQALEGAQLPRPMTHDLTKTLLEDLGADVCRVDVDSLQDNVFHAKIHLRLPDGTVHLVDSRPSDAMALALRFKAEIFAEESVLRSSAKVVVRDPEAADGDDKEEAWKEFLENLDQDAFGKYKM